MPFFTKRRGLRIKAGLVDEIPKFGCKIRWRQEAMVPKQFGVFPVQFLKFIQPMRSDFVDGRQSALGEFQPFRVDITCLDVAASLLRTSARVCCVDQSALVVHELIKVTSSSR